MNGVAVEAAALARYRREHNRFRVRPFLEFSRHEPARFDSIAEQRAAG